MPAPTDSKAKRVNSKQAKRPAKKRNSIDPAAEKPGQDFLQDPEGVKLTAGQMVLRNLERTGGQDAGKEICDYLIRRQGELLSGMSDWRTAREWVAALEENDFNWRTDPDDKANIFNQRNETLGLVRAGLRFVVSRALDDLFGTSPWMAAAPEGARANVG